VALGGCAPWLARPFAGLRPPPRGAAAHPRESARAGAATTPVATGCVGRTLARRDLQVSQGISIGPVAFLGLGRPRPVRRFRPGSPPVEVLALVPPRTQVTIGMDPSDGVIVATDGQLRASVACSAGAVGLVFRLGFQVPGPRCAHILVATAGRRWTRRVAFGVRGCTR